MAAHEGAATAAGTTVWLDAAIEKKTSGNNSDVRREENIARGVQEEAHYTVRWRVAFLARTHARVGEARRIRWRRTYHCLASSAATSAQGPPASALRQAPGQSSCAVLTGNETLTMRSEVSAQQK